jgi:hypothetical protein
MAKLGIPTRAGPREVKRNTEWLVRRVALRINDPARQMIGIEVDRQDPVGDGLLARYRW